ncbi:hypothetical protein PIB30_070457, partial [Stylosanthes scabra]|nr:hypothetical protein [Stylosanthes scabra]
NGGNRKKKGQRVMSKKKMERGEEEDDGAGGAECRRQCRCRGGRNMKSEIEIEEREKQLREKLLPPSCHRSPKLAASRRRRESRDRCY